MNEKARIGKTGQSRSGLTKGDAVGFVGVLDDDFRCQLRLKRMGIGRPLNEICGVLGINPSTFRKWEDGTVTEVRFHNIRILNGFLDGDYDSMLRPRQYKLPFPEKPVVARMREQFHNLVAIMTLTDDSSEQEQRILDGFVEFCNRCRREFVESLGQSAEGGR